MAFEIIRLGEKDAEIVASLRLESLLESPESFGMSYEEESVWGLEKTRERLRGQANGDRWIGCFQNGQLVGMASFQRLRPMKSRHKAEINAMFVKPEVRGRGVAKAIMQAIIAHAKSCENLTQIRLTVGANNLPAKKLYESFGFVEFGVELRSLNVNGHYIDTAHMAKQLLG